MVLEYLEPRFGCFAKSWWIESVFVCLSRWLHFEFSSFQFSRVFFIFLFVFSNCACDLRVCLICWYYMFIYFLDIICALIVMRISVSIYRFEWGWHLLYFSFSRERKNIWYLLYLSFSRKERKKEKSTQKIYIVHMYVYAQKEWTDFHISSLMVLSSVVMLFMYCRKFQ